MNAANFNSLASDCSNITSFHNVSVVKIITVFFLKKKKVKGQISFNIANTVKATEY